MKKELWDNVKKNLPSGSGFDTTWNVVDYDGKVVELRTEFHRMNEHGFYDGWIPVHLSVDAQTGKMVNCGVVLNEEEDYSDLITYIPEVLADALGEATPIGREE